MKTPFGKECKFFYGDYYRGKQIEDCRLINKSTVPRTWDVSYCKFCKVPDILLANACPNMVLSAIIKRTFPFIAKKVVVTAYCTKSHDLVKDPFIGCGLCHEDLGKFQV